MSQLKELLYKANCLLDKCFSILGYVLIKRDRMEQVLDRLDASIPEDIKEADRILMRKEQILQEAQNKASRMILDAQSEADRLVSESELLRAVKAEALKFKEQVIAECEELKKQTYSELDVMKVKAVGEAQKIREGAENYTEQVLSNLDQDLNRLQSIVRNGQEYLEQMRNSTNQNPMSYSSTDYVEARANSGVEFSIE